MGSVGEEKWLDVLNGLFWVHRDCAVGIEPRASSLLNLSSLKAENLNSNLGNYRPIQNIPQLSATTAPVNRTKQ
jgi:hypothetical protein